MRGNMNSKQCQSNYRRSQFHFLKGFLRQSVLSAVYIVKLCNLEEKGFSHRSKIFYLIDFSNFKRQDQRKQKNACPINQNKKVTVISRLGKTYEKNKML